MKQRGPFTLGFWAWEGGQLRLYMIRRSATQTRFCARTKVDLPAASPYESPTLNIFEAYLWKSCQGAIEYADRPSHQVSCSRYEVINLEWLGGAVVMDLLAKGEVRCGVHARAG